MKNKKKKSTGYNRPKPTDRFSFETSFCYWEHVVQSLELREENLEKELKVLEEVLPGSEAYWNIKVRYEDSRTIAAHFRAFLDEIVYGPGFAEEIARLANEL